MKYAVIVLLMIGVLLGNVSENVVATQNAREEAPLAMKIYAYTFLTAWAVGVLSGPQANVFSN